MRSTINTAAFQRKVENNAFGYLMKLGESVVNGAVRRVPVDTGTLMGSIHAEGYKSEMRVRVGSNLEYASPVEFGTYASKEPIAYDTHTRGAKPQPYLRPSLDELIQNLRGKTKRR